MKDQTKDDEIVMMQDEAQNQLARKKKVRDTKVVPNNFQEWFYNDTNKT